MTMHEIQQKIYKPSFKLKLKDLTLRAIAKEIGEKESPQLIKHHLNHLQKIGMLRGDLTPNKAGFNKEDNLIYLPIIGNCF